MLSTSFPLKLHKDDSPCTSDSCTRWNAKSTVLLLRGSKSQISSFTVVTAKSLQFSGAGYLSAFFLIVSIERPPVSISSISSAILPWIAGDFAVLVIYAWVRLSTKSFCFSCSESERSWGVYCVVHIFLFLLESSKHSFGTALRSSELSCFSESLSSFGSKENVLLLSDNSLRLRFWGFG
jgi:hypothetical protein